MQILLPVVSSGCDRDEFEKVSPDDDDQETNANLGAKRASRAGESMIGHNNGPSMEPGQSWRKHVWTRARADLLPRLPIEVLRLRVKRAEQLGLPYRTYASVRASTGRDVIGFLFSSNALRVLKAGQEVPAARAAKLASLQDVTRLALSHVGEVPCPQLEASFPAPPAFAGWSEMRDAVQRAVRDHRLPADGVLVVGETSEECLWAEAGKTAGYLSGARFFSATA